MEKWADGKRRVVKKMSSKRIGLRIAAWMILVAAVLVLVLMVLVNGENGVE